VQDNGERRVRAELAEPGYVVTVSQPIGGVVAIRGEIAAIATVSGARWSRIQHRSNKKWVQNLTVGYCPVSAKFETSLDLR